jgi:hypothetical protein
MTNGQQRRICPVVCAALLVFAMAPATYGQQEPEPDVHWAYASFFGTGWYKISDSREAFVVRAAPRWTVGQSGVDEQGKRKFDYTLRVPVTLGLTRFDLNDISGVIDPDNLSTMSVGFSTDINIPVNDRFSLRPIAEVGYGTVLGESEYAWSWRTELRSRYMFEAGKLDWALLASIGITGYEPNDGESDDFSFASLGAEFAYPINWMSSEDSQTMLYWHLGYMDFIDEIKFSSGPTRVDTVGNYWQFGLAMGRRDKPVKIWFLKFDRLGLGYKYSDTGRLRGITFVFRSLYDL